MNSHYPKAQFVFWGLGLMLPLVTGMSDSLLSLGLPGRWLYISVIAGALISSAAVVRIRVTTLQRAGLIALSLLVIVGEIIAMGTWHFVRGGLIGIQ